MQRPFAGARVHVSQPAACRMFTHGVAKRNENASRSAVFCQYRDGEGGANAYSLCMVQVISWLEPGNGITGTVGDAESMEAPATRVALVNASDIAPLTAKVYIFPVGTVMP